MNSTEHRRLRSAEAGEYVGLAAQTLAKMRCIGGGPPFMKVGKIVVYDTADLDAWLAARKRTSTSQTNIAA